MNTRQPEALWMAHDLESICISEEVHATRARLIAAELRRQHAELEILSAEKYSLTAAFDRLKFAFDEWLEKTDWVQKSVQPKELGKHRADILRERIEALKAENENLRAGYDAARLEIASLQARVQQLGQMARDVNSRRVVELEAQLEAVGAGGVSPLMGATAQSVAPSNATVFEFWWADHMPNSGRDEAWADWWLRSNQPAAQALDARDEAITLLRKYRKLCVEIGRGDSHHLGRIDAAIAAQQGGAACST